MISVALLLYQGLGLALSECKQCWSSCAIHYPTALFQAPRDQLTIYNKSHGISLKMLADLLSEEVGSYYTCACFLISGLVCDSH